MFPSNPLTSNITEYIKALPMYWKGAYADVCMFVCRQHMTM